VKLVFSTALGLYTFDCDRAVLDAVAPIGAPEYYGISARPDGLVLSHSCIDNGSLHTNADYVAAERGHLSISRGGVPLHTTGSELLQPHQIECNGTSIICANSGLNCITVFGLDLSPHHCYPTTARYDIGAGERKANHFKFRSHLRRGAVCVSP
jgi:hypothetical protein